MDAQFIVRAAGGPAKVAKHFNISIAAVMQWTRIPADKAIDVARLAKMPLFEVRGDLYPVEIFGEQPIE